MKTLLKSAHQLWTISAMALVMATSCQKEQAVPSVEDDAFGRSTTQASSANGNAILLAIDENSISNGSEPNFFTDFDINEDISRIGQRQTLRYFRNNIGKSIDLFTGEVGDEGWFALRSIPISWRNAGPNTNGARNYIAAGRGLGSGNDPELLLDKVPNLTPLRARGLSMLTGQTVLAVVYKGKISVNYAPLDGNLQGENLGLVAFQVERVSRFINGSSSSLPVVRIKILNVEEAKNTTYQLFSNAPAPRSSSLPFDVRPPATIPAIRLVAAP